MMLLPSIVIVINHKDTLTTKHTLENVNDDTTVTFGPVVNNRCFELAVESSEIFIPYCNSNK